MSRMGNYFYEVEFEDGRVIRRQNVTKTAAMAAFATFTDEMILLNVRSVNWGRM
jgi:hypothetical protein